MSLEQSDWHCLPRKSFMPFCMGLWKRAFQWKHCGKAGLKLGKSKRNILVLSENHSPCGLDLKSRPLFSLPEKQKSGVVDIFDCSKLFENFSRFKNGHFKCIQLETPTIVFEDFTLKSMIFENFSTVFYKGLCKGRQGISLFFRGKNRELCRIVLCVSVTLLSLKSYIKIHT